ncbi:hypothetical protein [Hymenobacter amundsenii]|uniref:hypothetical protein n=1 Tax=Hymenobacter amundsenii TaxID=2006685 RepID=UPI000F82FDEF|nr:hypothetical protein [Hymenobacter amundsenii]
METAPTVPVWGEELWLRNLLLVALVMLTVAFGKFVLHACIGGAVGAGAGAIIGNEKQKRKDERRRARETNNPNL